MIQPCLWLGVAFVGIAYHYCQSYGSEFFETAIVAIVCSTDILWSYIWQVLAFGEQSTLSAYVGAAIILGALWIVGLDELRSK